MSKKMGRPKNKVPTHPMCMRWPIHIADWFRIPGKKQEVINFAEDDLRKGGENGRRKRKT